MTNIIVRLNGNGYKAYTLDEPKLFELGLTAYEALANFIMKHETALGLAITFLKDGDLLPELPKDPFESMCEYLNFIYEVSEEGKKLKVGVFCDCYLREVDFLNFLINKLKKNIPFQYNETSPALVKTLQPNRQNGFMFIQMTIEPVTINIDTAVHLLKNVNFIKDLHLSFE